MKVSLYVISELCWLKFVSVLLNSKSAIHEIEYIMFTLVAIIAMSAGYSIGILEPSSAKTNEKPLANKKRFWQKPGDLS